MGCTKGDDAGRPRRAEQSLPQEDATPQRAVSVPMVSWRGLLHPLRCPIPVSRGPSGHAPGRTAKGGAVSSERRCDPTVGCKHPDNILTRSPASPPLPDPRSCGAPRATLWGVPFARSLTRQTACKASSHSGCDKIGHSWRCAPWHRSPGYDLRRAPYDHPDFTQQRAQQDLFSASLIYFVLSG
jgi:hypothetical protein